MDLRYPENTVWYIEARSSSHPREDGKYDSCGSGVVIWLRKKGELRKSRRYLLTCAHVVRGKSADGAAGYGPVLDDLRVWSPGEGFAPNAASVAQVAHFIKPLAPEGVVPEMRIAVDDWVILEVPDEGFRMSATAVKSCAEVPEGELTIIGYPGGSASFLDHLVKPTRSHDFEFRDLHDRVVRLHGNEARPGMSGGGLFDATGALIGIHRSRTDGILECHSVSAAYIHEELAAAGYDVVETRHEGRIGWHDRVPADGNSSAPGLNTSWSRRALLAGAFVATVLGGLYAPRIWTRKPSAKPAILCQIYDSLTQERILREFTIKYGDKTQACRVRESQLQVDESFFQGQEEMRIVCKGYESEPQQDCRIQDQEASDPQVTLRLFCLNRDETYLRSILPNVNALNLPIDDEVTILRNRNNPALKPDRITLLVNNETGHRPDILLLPLYLSTEPQHKSEKWVTIFANQTKVKKWSQPIVVLDIENAVFAACVSFTGEVAELIDTDAFYHSPFVVIRITGYNPPTGIIEHYSDDPRK